MRPDRHGSGDTGALQLAAAQLRGEFVDVPGFQLDLLQQVFNPGLARLGRHCAEMAQRLGNAPANAALGVEGAEGVLEYHLHALQKRRLAIEHDAALIGVFQAHQQARQCAFAAAAAPQQAKALALFQVQIQSVEHVHSMPFAEKTASGVTVTQVAYLNKAHGAQPSRVNE